MIFINIAIVIIFLITIVILCYFVQITRCFFQRGFVRTIVGILLTLFAVIAFFFSLHAGILSQYHKSINDKKDDKHGLYWFNPCNIVNYPIEQLKNHDFSVSYIDEISTYAEKPVNYIFVVDNSLSTLDNTDENVKKTIENHRLALVRATDRNKHSCLKQGSIEQSVLKLNKPSDFLLVSFVNQLYLNNNTDVHYSVAIYNGERYKDNKKIYTDDEIVEPISSMAINKNEYPFCLFINQYIDKIGKVTFPKERRTNFVKIIDGIQIKSVLREDCKNIITIISDFYHETNTDSFFALENSIKNLSKQAGDNFIVNLVVLAGKQSNNKQYDDINKTKSLINEHCKFVYYYEYAQGTLLNQRDINSYISSVVKYPQRDTSQKIVFYYPFDGDKYEEIKKTKIKFTKGGNYTLNIRNESLFSTPIFLKLTYDDNNDDNILIRNDYPIIERINNEYTYTAQIQTVNIPKNVFLEISNTSSKVKNQIPIVFRELVPKTVCYVLVLAYSLCALLLCICLLFFAMKFKVCKHTDDMYLHMKKKKGLFIGLLILCGIPLIIPVYYLGHFWFLHKGLFVLLLAVFIIIGGVTYQILKHECSLISNKCIEKQCRS
ncbi:MAG: hypothetical protein FWC41_09690 [Firmicutes bacterium]|nr:hypothetical protein [Bacillota bacterium]